MESMLIAGNNFTLNLTIAF